MSIRFLTEEYQENYGRYVGEPTSLQLARYFHLDDGALQLVQKRRGNHNRLGFAVQLGTVRFLGTFLSNPIDVPSGVISYLANQLEIADIDCLTSYSKRVRTHWEHIEEIKHDYGYRDFRSQPEHWRLIRWLYGRAWVSAESPSILFDVTTSQLVENKILLPGVTVLARLISHVRDRVQQRLYNKLSELPTEQQIEQLEAIIVPHEKSRKTILEHWRNSPTRISSIALVSTLERLQKIRSLELRKLDISKIPLIRLKSLSKTAFTIRVQAIARMTKERRIATLVAFVYVLETTVLDDSLDLLELLIKDLLSKSKREGKKEPLRTLKDLDTAALKLSQVGKILLNNDFEDPQVRAQVWEFITPEQLADAVIQVETLARPPEDNYYQELLTKWRCVRIFLPTLLKNVEFHSNKAGRPIKDALTFLQSIEGKRKPNMEKAPIAVVPKGWKAIVLKQDDTIDQKAYTFCILEQLVERVSEKHRSNPPSPLKKGEKELKSPFLRGI